MAFKLTRRWLGGEVCAVPGCARDRVTQHDHFNARRWQGMANAQLDRRLCGPCNRARARGQLNYRHTPAGIAVFHDARGRTLGTLRLGAAWVPAIRAWAERVAATRLGRAAVGDAERLATETALEQTTPTQADPPPGERGDFAAA